MSNDELQQLVESISLQYFGKAFVHQATFNHRLRAIGGRYMTKSHHLEFNKKSFEKYGFEELIGIIKHELCHYHLHLEGKGFRHRDRSFKECLGQVNGSRFSKPIYRSKKEYKYKIRCLQCNQDYYRVRKMNVNNYRCGKCKGDLEISLINSVNENKNS